MVPKHSIWWDNSILWIVTIIPFWVWVLALHLPLKLGTFHKKGGDFSLYLLDVEWSKGPQGGLAQKKFGHEWIFRGAKRLAKGYYQWSWDIWERQFGALKVKGVLPSDI